MDTQNDTEAGAAAKNGDLTSFKNGTKFGPFIKLFHPPSVRCLSFGNS